MKLAAQGFRKTLNKGFTLIELLVVIGILGILAAALVATIDPFEQLNKANDANSKNAAVEFLNANIRYYTTHNAMPWDTTGSDCLSGTTDLAAINLTSGAMYSTCIPALVSEGELKAAFTTATSILGNLYANETGDNITMCYKPKSKSQQRDANTRYNQDGTAHATCTGGPSNPTGPSATCYWCTQ
jgi:prepilin-type N-terminal cleavage/methylation domain-containing protein